MVIEARFMEYALEEAKSAAEMDEVPVGAVVVKDGEIVSRAHNETERTGLPSRHAEMLALERAAERVGRDGLSDCVLYVTMEPCPMCAGACVNFRIGAVVFGAFDSRMGAFGSVVDLGSDVFGREIPVVGGVMKDGCSRILTEFFKKKR